MNYKMKEIMDPELNKYAAGLVSNIIELMAVVLIAGTIVILIFNNFYYAFRRDEAKFKLWRKRSWRLIQGSLDLFVASDLLSTITIDRTLEGVVTLGILLIVRTLISWSLEIEADGLAMAEKSI